jgi:hypothetical protein
MTTFDMRKILMNSSKSESSCPFCRFEAAEELPVTRKYSLRSLGQIIETSFQVCVACGGVWQTTPPSEQLLADYYQSNTQFRESPPRTADIRVMNEQIDFFCSDTSLAGKNALEYGPSVGYFLDLLRSRTDANTYYNELSERCIGILNKKGHSADGPSRKLDAIFLLHTLEHILKPAYFIDQVAHRLSCDGFLAIEVPDHSLWDERTATDNFEHISYFSAHSLSSLLRNCGLLIDRLETSYNPDFAVCNRRVLRVRARPAQQYLGQIVPAHFNNVIDARKLTLAKLTASNKSIGIYGVGMLTDLLMSDSPIKPDRVSAYFDGDPEKHGSIYFGKVVTPPAGTSSVEILIIVSSAEDAIRNDLAHMGYRGEIFGLDDLID